MRLVQSMSKSQEKDKRVNNPSSSSHDSQSETCSSPSTSTKRTKKTSKWQEDWKHRHSRLARRRGNLFIFISKNILSLPTIFIIFFPDIAVIEAGQLVQKNKTISCKILDFCPVCHAKLYVKAITSHITTRTLLHYITIT